MTIIENLPFCDDILVGDIEDVLGNETRQQKENTNVKIHVRRNKKKVDSVLKQQRNRRKEEEEENVSALIEDPPPAEVQSNDINPHSHKIYMKTWGCSHNTSDSEYMAGLLTQYGFQLSQNKEESTVWILNSCTVKGPSEQHFKNEVEEGRSANKNVIVSGCVPQGEPRSEYIKGLSVIGVKQIDEIVHVVEESLKGNTVRLLSFMKKKKNEGDNKQIVRKNPPGASLNFPKIRKNELIEIIPVSTGCLNSCTYCKTKLARGNLSSYTIEEITERAREVIGKEGVKEIWLTSEDLGAWGIDLGLNIVDLLRELVKCIPEDCMLRLGMTNPPYILDHLQEMSEILNDPRVYGFLHIPVQAASDSVLLEMKREYTRNQFETIVNFLKQRVPDLTIATDVICGFPTETESDFQETFDLVEKYKFPVLYINQFYPRPGTQAAKMPRIPTHIVKQRTKRLTQLFLSYSPFYNNDETTRVGQVYTVLITEVSHDKAHLVGHNKAYEQILIKPRKRWYFMREENLMGKKIKVRIVSVPSKFSMVGVPLDNYHFQFVLLLFSLIVLFIAYLIKF